MDERLNPAPDGPWLVASTFHVLVRSRPLGRDAWAAAGTLASRLARADLPASRIVVVGASRPDAPDQDQESFSGVPVASAGDLAAALRSAVEAEADCLVLDDAVDLDAEAIDEVRRLAGTDPMIAGVSPRIGAPESAPAGSGLARAALPDATYVPLPDRRCLYLKGSVLAQFRPDLGTAEVDWDDYALSINRYGFRMVVANHAVVRHPPGSESIPRDELPARLARLERVYPGARSAVASFLTGAPRVAERLLAALVPDSRGRRELAFDLTHLGPHHSGTAELARALIQGAASSWRERWDVFVVAHPASYDFHFADAPIRPQRIDPEDPRIFAAFIRIGQPFSWKELDHAVRRAPALVFFMLDTIGLDCIRLAPDELDALWRFTLAEADGLLFNSAFTQRQFERRFALRPDIPKRPSLHSLRVEDYGRASLGEPQGESVLIIGNGFAHKYVEEAARLIAAAHPERPVVALGPKPATIAGVTSHVSGSLDPATMAGLYRDARIVIYPSLYEGFGFPVLEALAHRRPVLVRALAPFAELLRELPEAANVHVFRTDADLIRLVGSELRWTNRRNEVNARGWDESTADLLFILEEAMDRVSYHRVLRRVEFMRGRMEWIRRKRFRALQSSAGALDEDVERLAGFAGRMAQDAVLKLARAPGGQYALGLARRMLRRRAGP